MANSTDYKIRFRETTDYLKIVCATYKFPLFGFVYSTCIKELRDKLYNGILLKLQEDYANTRRNKDYDFGIERLQVIKKELDNLMIEKN